MVAFKTIMIGLIKADSHVVSEGRNKPDTPLLFCITKKKILKRRKQG